MDIRQILCDIGYSNLTLMGDFLRGKPIYRACNSSAPLSVNVKTGYFRDFGTNQVGNLTDLVSLSLGCSIEEAKKITKSEYTTREPIRYRMDDIPLTLGNEEIKHLIPAYQYFNKRGISTEILKYYESGLATSGKMSDRFTFPIKNKKNQLIGLAGRDVTGYKAAKWKILGRKNSFDYPYLYNKDYIASSNEVILVEGISDMLALAEAGIKNTLVLFGLSIGKELLLTLLTINKKIWIATNNDPEINGISPGRDAAEKLRISLGKWFDQDKIIIKFPPKVDFGEMNSEEIKNWYNK